MKPSFFVSALVVLVLVPLGQAYAKNDNASVGTKELLARIEALEEAVMALSPPDNSVSGSVYQTHSLGSGLAAFIPFPGQFHLVFNADRILTFNPDGTGSWVTLACDNQQLTVIADNPPSLAPAGPGCGTAFETGFTYIQLGNTVEITSDDQSVSLLFTVSNSGDVIIDTGFNVSPGAPAPFSLASGAILVGVRIAGE